MSSIHMRVVAAAWLVLGCAAPVLADVKLPNVLSSHMVLQRDKPLPIWGWADPGEKIVVSLGDSNKADATADAAGKWKVKLAPMKAGGEALTLTIRGKNTVTLDDILIGEVWMGRASRTCNGA